MFPFFIEKTIYVHIYLCIYIKKLRKYPDVDYLKGLEFEKDKRKIINFSLYTSFFFCLISSIYYFCYLSKIKTTI